MNNSHAVKLMLLLVSNFPYREAMQCVTSLQKLSHLIITMNNNYV